ncbi:MAG: TRAP transporter fused permease subunit [Alphaproteobacteria bacterium]|nr:TRAP transporter fused permease subunit [Alphaproteobacteria bacterium]
MTAHIQPPAAPSADTQHKIEELIEAEEGAFNRYKGLMATLLLVLAIGSTLFHLYAAVGIVSPDVLRPAHVGIVLVLSFLSFPLAKRLRNRMPWWDIPLVLLAIWVIAYAILGGDNFTDRNTLPNQWDMIAGAIFIVLILEATRRSGGLVMPIVCILFLAYAVAGPYLPPPWTHRGYDLGRLVGHLYMTLEGIFGTAVDVSSTLIILFTIYGAFLQQSGAGKFFIDFSFSAMGGKPASAGRGVVLSSFLLGGPSGSGVATTVTIGSVSYPLLARAGFGKNDAGGLLAAGGLGAILSPPVMGAAAFLIAEFLKISYLDVIRMAVVPTCLYYLSLLIMVELGTRNAGKETMIEPLPLGAIVRDYWFHFSSLIAIIAFMMFGFSPMMSVFWATVLAYLSSFLHRDCAMGPRKLVAALAEGTTGVLNVAATCAAAGIIVGVVTLTGLGLKFSAIAIEYAGGSLALTALYTAFVVWIVGLAVPVTASYIICAVITAPALTKLGVPDFAAHMFIFYYALLSEVTPPTALSPFAAAAITGGNPYFTTFQSWKYTMPAFVVPFMFVLDPAGVGILLATPKVGGLVGIIVVIAAAAVGTVVLAAAMQGRMITPLKRWEQAVLIAASIVIMFPDLVDDWIEPFLASTHGQLRWAGIAVALTVSGAHWLRARRQAA